MNVFELMTIVLIPAGAWAGFSLAAPFGAVPAVVAAACGGVAGRWLGPVVGLLILLPFEAVARLRRYLTAADDQSLNRDRNVGS